MEDAQKLIMIYTRSVNCSTLKRRKLNYLSFKSFCLWWWIISVVTKLFRCCNSLTLFKCCLMALNFERMRNIYETFWTLPIKHMRIVNFYLFNFGETCFEGNKTCDLISHLKHDTHSCTISETVVQRGSVRRCS